MGADSGVGSGETFELLGQGANKLCVRQLGTEKIVFGIVGSGRLGQVLQVGHDLPPLNEGGDVMRWLVSDLCAYIRELFGKEQTLSKEDGVAYMDAFFLIGFRGVLYQMMNDFSIIPLPDPFVAIGSGRGHAQGVFFATPGEDPEKRINMAFEAVARWNTNVRAPFLIINI